MGIGQLWEDLVHEADVVLVRELRELLRVRGRSDERLLDQHVLAARDRGLRERIMRLERRRDHDGIEILERDQARRVLARDNAAVPPPRRVAAIGASVGDCGQTHTIGLVEVAREVRSPVPVADEAHADHGRTNSVAASAMY